MIELTHNAHDCAKQVENAVAFIGSNFRVGLNLSDRSKTIIYWQAVNHGRDATDAIGDIEEGEVEQCFSEPMEAAISVGDTEAARREAAENLGELLRKFLIAGIDDEDLIDTGELREDVSGCTLVFEGI